jgi:hypothetical protein
MRKFSKNIFNKKDYNSPDGMMTSIWGPALWHTLHTISFNYPVKPTKEDKENYYNYFKSLQNILPCKYCRDNLKKNLKKLPLKKIVFKNRESLSKYVYLLHEEVNKMLGKKSGLTYTQVRDRYEHFRSRCITPLDKKPNKKIESGCTESLYGVKGKCVINIVPHSKKTPTFVMDKSCQLKRQ